jgi:rhamnosyltransferase
MRRAAVFVFYDKDGVADAYVDYYLCALREHVERLVVVSNCEPTENTRAMLSNYTDEFVVRENKGFGTGAYKAGIYQVGWDHISGFDEVILCNDSVFGPVYPLSEMFDVMSDSEFDFWGITRLDLNGFEDIAGNEQSLGDSPGYIQGYFTVFGAKVLQSKVFKEYWDQYPEEKPPCDALCMLEATFTKYFADAGFTWGAYAQPEEVDKSNPDITLFQAFNLISKRRSPFVNTKLFTTDVIYSSAGEQPRKVLDYIDRNTAYDVDMIYEKIIRTSHQYDFVKTLAMTYVLSASTEINTGEKGRAVIKKVAFIMHMYFPDLFEEGLTFAKRMPCTVDIYITTNTEEKKELIENLFLHLENRVEVRVVENRGRSESALLVGMADIIPQYELLCFWKEKKSVHFPFNMSSSWSYKINENLLSSEIYIRNIIHTFELNPRLGLLSPGAPIHSTLMQVTGNEWASNYENAKRIADDLNFGVPMSEEMPPIAPFGGSFWFRPEALRPLLDARWGYGDFPEEPLASDGTFLHAIERVYSLSAQSAGFFPARAYTEEYAALEISNLLHYIRQTNVLMKSAGYSMYDYCGLSATLEAMALNYCNEKNRAPQESVEPVEYSAYQLLGKLARKAPKPLFYVMKFFKILIAGPNRKRAFAEMKRVLKRG